MDSDFHSIESSSIKLVPDSSAQRLITIHNYLGPLPVWQPCFLYFNILPMHGLLPLNFLNLIIFATTCGLLP